jgi:diguanylate cyclase (GGDEF)-like protein/PAS domain S-box-containing protein
MQRRERLSVGVGLMTSYLVILGGMAAVCVMLIIFTQQQAAITEDLYTHPFAVSNASIEARQKVAAIRNEVLFAVMSRNPLACEAAGRRVAVLHQEMLADLDAVDQFFLGDLSRVAEARSLDQRWQGVIERILAKGADGRFDAAEQIIFNEGTPLYGEIVALLDYVAGFARDKAAFFAAAAKEHSYRAFIYSVALLGGGVVVTLIIASAVTGRTLARMQQGVEAARLAHSVIDNTDQAVMVTEADGTIVAINPAFTAITGYAAHDAIGDTPRLLRSGRHDADFYDALWTDLATEGRWQGRLWNRRKDGEAFLAWATITALRDHGQVGTRFISMFSDVTETHREDEDYRHRACHDHLTGLPNRHVLGDRLAHIVALAERAGERAAVMFIDLDGFKAVNDSLGHDAGDLLLIEVADRLKATLRRCDTVARLGGDEFVAVLAGLPSAEEVAIIADKVVAAMAVPVQLGNDRVTIGASIGVALFPDDGLDAVTLLQQADSAMYRAKQEGKNTWRLAAAAV